MQNSQLIKLRTKDKKEISLWKIYSKKNNRQHLFLTHGTFSDKKIMLGIAKYFSNLGYTCWIMEWRNHGSNHTSKDKFNIETIGLIDVKTAFDYLINKQKINQLSCVTHSGGGIALTLFLIKNKTYETYIKSIVFFNCQAFGAVTSKWNYLKIFTAKYLSSILGIVPGKKLGLGVHNETYYTMKQWFNWNLTKTFNGVNGFDYLNNMKHIKTPILSICAENDKFIAPIVGCKKYLDAFKNPKNELLICSVNNGFLENYNHSRTILSKNASKEVWQIALNWIKKH